ncbi:Major facilitator superfamily [Carpediemonas membranifera]|uniref:Major facilitator superfamily n=1 Tax=Carpediemonas membranifera TaxID=201153 RepID=A0A8J6AXN7_9EUKA|nr:Major facilitator superfamily [Carpediemonas membranifera]|eukprot:KAG9397381.1 Major facilitator superfamily [Carpediemonas membranifera]
MAPLEAKQGSVSDSLSKKSYLTRLQHFSFAGVFALSIFSISICLGLIYPIVTIVLKSDAMGKRSDLVVGVFSALNSLAMMTGSVLGVRVMSRFGTFPTYFAAVMVDVVLIIALYFTIGHIFVWLLIYCLFGFISSIPWVVAEIWLNTIHNEKYRAMCIGLYTTLLGTGLALGPLLLSIFNPLHFPVYLICAICGSLNPVILTLVASTAPDSESSPISFRGVWSALKLCPLFPFVAVFFGGIHVIHDNLMIAYSLDMGLTQAVAGQLLSVMLIGNIIFQIPYSIILKVIGTRNMLFSVLLILIFSSALIMLGYYLLFLTTTHHFPSKGIQWYVAHEIIDHILHGAMVLYGAAVMGSYSLPVVWVGSGYPASMYGPATTLYLFCTQLGGVMIPFCLGFAMKILPQLLYICIIGGGMFMLALCAVYFIFSGGRLQIRFISDMDSDMESICTEDGEMETALLGISPEESLV